MKRLVIIVFFILFFSQVKHVSADVINPDFSVKKCEIGETQVVCTYRSSEPFGPLTYDGCIKYKDNPNYRKLVSGGHSFGGSVKYCLSSSSISALLEHHTRQILPLLLLTLVIELPIFALFGFRKRGEITTIIIVNIVSVALFYFFARVLFGSYLFLPIFIGEVFVIVFEGILIKLKYKDKKHVFAASIVANFISAIFGTILLFLFLLWF